MAHRKKRPINPRFQLGDKVRVKPGISDVLFPDMPLGGWSGSVTEIIMNRVRSTICSSWTIEL